jgi:KAP family P-loop domain
MQDQVIFQDLPAADPALKFPSYAATLAGIISNSKPQFAIGLFGGWGSGKTTLMNAIARQLVAPDIVKVEFSAWRYEREPNLVVPMLDAIREALDRWSKTRPALAPVAQEVVKTLGKAVRALLAGFGFKAGIPTAMEISFDASKTIDEWGKGGDAADKETARSLYHACFSALREAFEKLSAAEPAARIVVFVDDLDRCLPNAAIEVIEAMKLFFDLHGFVFVVGLDQKVIEAAVEVRYSEFNRSVTLAESKVSGEDYIKKIFQVPFSLAPVRANDIGPLVDAFLRETGAPAQQEAEIRGTVLPHLRYLAGSGPVNPRDIKRYINAFTITRSIQPMLDVDVILTLQSMTFRPDWRRLYQALVAFRLLFVRALADYVGGNSDPLENLDDELASISQEFATYISDGPGAALINGSLSNLDDYIYAGEAARSSGDTSLTDLIPKIAEIRGKLRDMPPRLAEGNLGMLVDLRNRLRQLREEVGSHSLPRGTAALVQARLREAADLLDRVGLEAKVGDERDLTPAISALKDVIPLLLAYS